jgi:hypothetical protein
MATLSFTRPGIPILIRVIHEHFQSPPDSVISWRAFVIAQSKIHAAAHGMSRFDLSDSRYRRRVGLTLLTWPPGGAALRRFQHSERLRRDAAELTENSTEVCVILETN